MLSKSTHLGKKNKKSIQQTYILIFTNGLLHSQIFPLKKKVKNNPHNKTNKNILPYVSSHVLSVFHKIVTGIRARKARSMAEYSYK